jgi:hypothetical protein
MYSGHHVTTKTGHARKKSSLERNSKEYKKKKKQRNEKTLSFDPKTFQPGNKHILVEMIEKTVKVMVGIICR